MWARYPPTPPFHCGENEIQASLISSASAGAAPAPATNLREVIRLPVCKTGVFKQAGSDDWSITSTSHQPSPPAPAGGEGCRAEPQRRRAVRNCVKLASARQASKYFSGLVAQSEEQPVVCGKAEGASPFESAILSERSLVFRARGLGPRGRR